MLTPVPADLAHALRTVQESDQATFLCSSFPSNRAHADNDRTFCLRDLAARYLRCHTTGQASISCRDEELLEPSIDFPPETKAGAVSEI